MNVSLVVIPGKVVGERGSERGKGRWQYRVCYRHFSTVVGDRKLSTIGGSELRRKPCLI
jgi:hypothetical protein